MGLHGKLTSLFATTIQTRLLLTLSVLVTTEIISPHFHKAKNNKVKDKTCVFVQNIRGKCKWKVFYLTKKTMRNSAIQLTLLCPLQHKNDTQHQHEVVQVGVNSL